MLFCGSMAIYEYPSDVKNKVHMEDFILEFQIEEEILAYCLGM